MIFLTAHFSLIVSLSFKKSNKCKYFSISSQSYFFFLLLFFIELTNEAFNSRFILYDVPSQIIKDMVKSLY